MNPRLQAFLSEIADFSNVGRRSNNPSPMNSEPKFGRSQIFQEPDLNNNAKLIAQFKAMREKIKLLSKENSEMKIIDGSLQSEKQSRYKSQLASLQEKDAQNTAALNFLRREMDQINSGIDQLKMRNAQLQQQLSSKHTVEREMEYLQSTVIQLKQSNDELKRENEKLSEIGIMEKIELEGKIKNMQLNKEVDKQYVQQLEMELNKAREKCLSIESKLRRVQNECEESRFDREKLAQSNTKQKDLEHIISDLKKQKNKLKTAFNQERQRRLKAESMTMQKEGFSSLYAIQIETLEREVLQLKKRNKKWSQRCEQKQLKAEAEAYKNIDSKSKLYRCMQITEECMGRVKRELNVTGQLLQFIKSCEFKIAKLKDDEEQGRTSNRQSLSRSKSKSKPRVQSMSALKIGQSPLKSSMQKPKKKLNMSDSEQQIEQSGREGKRSETQEEVTNTHALNHFGDILKERNRVYSKQQASFSKDYSEEPLSKPLRKEDLDFGRSTTKENLKDQDIDRKVRREREQKERKIREGILYKKLEACSSDRDRTSVREQILRLGKDNI